ncbi:MAG: DUF4234 domain-containing protein [Verrucomicrobiales bacterium]|jgi:hypothetical protein|nr:DUF4234 domain-containing protein [Verrucomicrobiales bacterium]
MNAKIKPRSFLTLLLLTLLTLGIYFFIWVNGVARDVNAMCREDGKRAGGGWKFFFLTPLTLGIYALLFWCGLFDRVRAGARRRGVSVSEGAGTFLAWAIFGHLLCGIGSTIALFIFIKNFNALARAGDGNGGSLPPADDTRRAGHDGRRLEAAVTLPTPSAPALSVKLPSPWTETPKQNSLSAANNPLLWKMVIVALAAAVLLLLAGGGAAAWWFYYQPFAPLSARALDEPVPGAPASLERTLLVLRGTREVARVPVSGSFLGAFASPDNKYLAVNQRPANAGNYVRVFRRDGVELKAADGDNINFAPAVECARKKTPRAEMDDLHWTRAAEGWADHDTLTVLDRAPFANLRPEHWPKLRVSLRAVGDTLTVSQTEVLDPSPGYDAEREEAERAAAREARNRVVTHNQLGVREGVYVSGGERLVIKGSSLRWFWRRGGAEFSVSGALQFGRDGLQRGNPYHAGSYRTGGPFLLVAVNLGTLAKTGGRLTSDETKREKDAAWNRFYKNHFFYDNNRLVEKRADWYHQAYYDEYREVARWEWRANSLGDL